MVVVEPLKILLFRSLEHLLNALFNLGSRARIVGPGSGTLRRGATKNKSGYGQDEANAAGYERYFGSHLAGGVELNCELTELGAQAGVSGMPHAVDAEDAEGDRAKQGSRIPWRPPRPLCEAYLFEVCLQ